MPISFIESILDTGGGGPGGCKYLSLWSADISGRNLVLNKASQLKYLDLNYCKANDHEVFESMLSACHSLQKLSMANLTLTPFIMKGISNNGETLQILNIRGCRGSFTPNWPPNAISPSFMSIISKCVELTELNLGSLSGFPQYSINFLVKNLTPKIEKLGLSELSVNDFHIEVLLSRCNKIKELDLKKTLITQKSVDSIIKHLYTTLEKLDLSYTKIQSLQIRQFDVLAWNPLESMNPLASMPRLGVLNFRDLDVIVVNILSKRYPHLKINREYFHLANSDQTFQPREGFWEIKAQQLPLF